MRKPPDFTTERYLRDLRDEARVKRAAATPAIDPDVPAVVDLPAVVVPPVAGP